MNFCLKVFSRSPVTRLLQNTCILSQNAVKHTISHESHPEVEEIEAHKDDFIQLHLANVSNFAPADWESFKKDLLDHSVKFRKCRINKHNVNSYIISYCWKRCLIPEGQAFLKYLLQGEKMNIFSLSYYMRFLAVDYETALKNKDMILKIYKQLKTSNLLNSVNLRLAAESLSFLKDYCHEAEALTHNECFACSTNTHNILIRNMFALNEIELGWKILERESSGPANCSAIWEPHPSVFQSLCKSIIMDYQCLPKHLKNFCDKLCFLELNITGSDLLKDFTEAVNVCSVLDKDYTWRIKENAIKNDTGFCNECDFPLSNKMTSEEQKMIHEMFDIDYLNLKGALLKSTPTEIQNFKLFLKNLPEFDIVIDSCSLYYSGMKSDVRVNSILQQIQGKGMKPILIGKKHVARHVDPQSVLRNLRRTFFTSNESPDDIFVIATACHGNKLAKIATNDFLRSEIFLASCDADIWKKKILRKWQLLYLHTYKFGYRARLEEPAKYHKFAQKVPGLDDAVRTIWHIPYISKNDITSNSTSLYTLRDIDWLCIERKRKHQT